MAETVKERKNLESVMRSDPQLSEILNQLLEQGSEDLVQVRFHLNLIFIYVNDTEL